ncbi:MAG: carboxypeptidase-like regulatory domain-containing protein [Methanobacteriota archaeon]
MIVTPVGLSSDTNPEGDLIIHFQESFVIEGQQFVIKVTNEIEAPVENAEITAEWFTEMENPLLTNNTGDVTLIAPFVDIGTEYIITATKSGYKQAQLWLVVKDNVTTPIEQLNIEASSTVTEGAAFQVRITASSGPISNATIQFLDQTTHSNANGIGFLNAPFVDSDTSYSIIASKNGFTSKTITITVLDLYPENSGGEGWIYGQVSTIIGMPLEAVSVCAVRLSDTGTYCTSSDGQGRYNLSLPLGVYLINASTPGYQSSIVSDVIIEEHLGTQINLVLEIAEPEEESSENQTLITQAIENGAIAGKIIITQEQRTVTYTKTMYANITVDLSLNEEKKIISLFIQGEHETGKSLLVVIDKTLFSLDTIVVEYDDARMKKADSLADVLNANDDGSTPEYYIVDDTFLVSIPHFSTHEVTISQVFDSIMVIIWYVVCCGIVVLFVGVHRWLVWR